VMELVSDARCLALPCVLAAGVLQYTRFAKKPMAAPCHRLSERLARRCVFAGLAAELVGLRLLPLCEAYPMNASCLVFLYFWKESKRSRSVHKGEVLACASALSAWALPFLNPADSKVSEATQVSLLLDAMMAPSTCLYVVGMLACSVVVHCIGHGQSVIGSCTPPGMNFGVSALLLKAFTQVAGSLVLAPLRLELWAAMVSIVTLLFGVRSAASTPLRRALEVHDNLSVLACYGVVSSAAAALTGSLVFGEMAKWDLKHQAIYGVVAAAHCWGMCTLGQSGSEVRGHKDTAKDPVAEEAPTGNRKGSDFGKALQMAEFSGRGAASNGASGLASGSSSAQPKKDGPPSPLLRFNEPSARRSVDEDAQMEEKLFAHALAPLHLGPEMGGLPAEDDGGSPWASAWQDAGGGVEAACGAAAASGLGPQQFDADFEEIMRRFNEDDQQCSDQVANQPITEISPSASGPALPDATPPSVLTYDAQTLLDSCGVQEDEDELLRCIEDIPGP